LFEEISYQILESSVVAGRKATLEDRTQGWSVSCEQSKTAFCSPDITGKNHRRLTTSACSIDRGIANLRALISEIFVTTEAGNPANKVYYTAC